MFIPDTAALFRRLEAAGWPAMMISGQMVGGNEARWSRQLPLLLPVELGDVQRHLPELEERQARHNELMTELDRQSAERRERDRAASAYAIRQLLGE